MTSNDIRNKSYNSCVMLRAWQLSRFNDLDFSVNLSAAHKTIKILKDNLTNC